MADFTAWHGKTLAEHVQLRDNAAKGGYRFLSLSVHGTTGSPRYTAVMIKRPVGGGPAGLAAAHFRRISERVR